jgi:hypothetical protein
MSIELKKAQNEDYAPTLKFKDLAKKDYLIVSKKFDEPLEGPSQYCKNTGGNWYLFKLDLHEYSFLNDDEERETITEVQEVSYFDGDNEYEKDDGSWFQTQGTVLKALNVAAVGEKIKITMAENAKGKKVYSTESLGGGSEQPEPKSEEKTAPEGKSSVETKIASLKTAGMSIEEVVKMVSAAHPELSAEEIERVYNQ